MLCCSAVLNTEWLRFHSLLEHRLADPNATTSGYRKVSEYISSNLLEWEVELVVLLVSPPHFWMQAANEPWVLKFTLNNMIIFF